MALNVKIFKRVVRFMRECCVIQYFQNYWLYAKVGALVWFSQLFVQCPYLTLFWRYQCHYVWIHVVELVLNSNSMWWIIASLLLLIRLKVFARKSSCMIASRFKSYHSQRLDSYNLCARIYIDFYMRILS